MTLGSSHWRKLFADEPRLLGWWLIIKLKLRQVLLPKYFLSIKLKTRLSFEKKANVNVEITIYFNCQKSPCGVISLLTFFAVNSFTRGFYFGPCLHSRV